MRLGNLSKVSKLERGIYVNVMFSILFVPYALQFFFLILVSGLMSNNGLIFQSATASFTTEFRYSQTV